MTKQKVVLIDGNSLMHRAYHGVKFAPVLNGMPLGMVYGFASMLINIIAEFKPDYLIVAFDTKEKTFRHEMDQEYKAHRIKADDDFYAQIPLVHKCLESFRVQVVKAPGYEADDVIGTLATRAREMGFLVEIVSSDLDFLQLVSDDGISLLKANGSIQNTDIFTPKETREKLGVDPCQVIDYKAIVGDSSDNYKGIPGVGPKTAVSLLVDYGDLSGIYENLVHLPSALKAKFEDNREYAFHCYTLAKIKTDVPINVEFELFNPAEESVLAFLNELKFFSLMGRYKKTNNNIDHENKNEQLNNSEKGLVDNQMSLF